MENVRKAQIKGISNPVLASLGKVNETSESRCTYMGIAVKTIIFLILTGIGVAMYYIIHGYLVKSGELGGLVLGRIESYILIGAGIIAFFSAIFATFFKGATAFWGSLYSICEGAIIAYLTITYAREYSGIVWETLGLTMLIIVTMLILYCIGVVKVNKRFTTAITTLLVVSILSSIIYFLLSVFVPNNPIQELITTNGPIAIGISAIGVLIAALFLVTDFDNIKQAVVNEMPKKYEWVASFGLVFTVLWLYLKVLALVSEIANRSQ